MSFTKISASAPVVNKKLQNSLIAGKLTEADALPVCGADAPAWPEPNSNTLPKSSACAADHQETSVASLDDGVFAGLSAATAP